MDRQPRITTRFCAACNAPLRRRFTDKEIEDADEFKKRKYCGADCEAKGPLIPSLAEDAKTAASMLDAVVKAWILDMYPRCPAARPEEIVIGTIVATVGRDFAETVEFEALKKQIRTIGDTIRSGGDEISARAKDNDA